MQVDWFTFIAQVINFLILIALLHRFLFKPVMKAMEERDQKITDELEEARLKKVEAEQKERQLEHELDHFEAQKDQLMQEAREEVAKKRKLWMDELRSEISEIRTQWIQAVESEKESFLKQLKEETAQQVVRLIEKVLVDLSERNLKLQTADFFFHKIDQLDQDEIKQLKKTITDHSELKAEVLSTFELNAEQKENLIKSIDEITGIELDYQFKISEELGFGIEIHIAGWRLGWNLKSYLEGLRRNMEHFFQSNVPLEKSTEVQSDQ